MIVDGGQFIEVVDGGSFDVEPTEPTYAGHFQDFWFEADVELIPRYSVQPHTESVTVQDALIQRDWTGVFKMDHQITPRQTRFKRYEPVSFQSSNEAIATVSADGKVKHLTNGEVTISAVSNTRTAAIKLNLQSEADQYTDTILNGVAGSARKDATDAVMDRIDGETPSVAKPIFSTQDHSTPTYTRNTNCWAADLDLTPISPWNSHNSYRRAGILISPRHILFAGHYMINNSSTIRFVDASNNVITRTMTAKERHPDYSYIFGPQYDIAIGLLDSDVPAGIGFAKVLPDDWEDYLPNSGTQIPALTLDQEEKALIKDPSHLSFVTINPRVFYPYPSTNPSRLAFDEDLIDGDSGNPVCMILGGELVLLCVHTTPEHGSAIHENKTEINQMMTDLGGGYQLTEIDLTSFNNYGA